MVVYYKNKSTCSSGVLVEAPELSVQPKKFEIWIMYCNTNHVWYNIRIPIKNYDANTPPHGDNQTSHTLALKEQITSSRAQ